MSRFLAAYGDAEGPLGFPMKDADAKILDQVLKDNPEAEYHRVVVEKATTELMDGERADVSWIQTEIVDRVGDIVLTSGFRDDHFKGNPIVTINHDYTKSPVGRSLWRRKVRDGDRLGIKAKTIYPARPEEWKEPIWPSDTAWALVKSGLMAGKSIGFIATKSHVPTEDEIRRRPELQKVRRIVDEWYLLEYCCCWLPVNPEACVDAVSKSLVTPEALSFVGQELPKAHTPGRLPEIIPFRPLAEIEKAVQKQFQKLDLSGYIKNGWKQAYEKAKGAA